MSQLIQFPQDLRIGFKSGGVMTLTRKGSSLRSAFSAKRQAISYPYALWTYKGDIVPVDDDAASLFRSFLTKLQGQTNKFQFPVPGVFFQGAKFTGNSPLVNGSGQTGTALNLEFLAGNQLLFKEGDYFTVNDELKMVTSDCWVNSSGYATVNFLPALRSSPNAYQQIYMGATDVGSGPTINLLKDSVQFSSPDWYYYNSNITHNTLTDPFGNTLNLPIFVPNTTNINHSIFQNTNIIKNIPYTFSIYLKQNGNYNLIELQLTDNIANGIVNSFDLAAGNMNVVSFFGNAVPIFSSIISIGNGWFRCSISGSFDSNLISPSIFALNNSSTSNFAADGTSGYNMCYAQMEKGGSPTNVRQSFTGEGIPYVIMAANIDDIAAWTLNPPVQHSFTLDLIEAFE